MTHTHRNGLIALIFATLLWAVSFPLTKSLMLEQARLLPDAGTWFFSAWSLALRFGLAGMMLLPWIWRQHIHRDEWKQGLQLAFWGGFGMWAQSDGLAYTAASTSAFFTQGYCVFLPLWFAMRLRRAPSARVVCATIMVLAGGAWIAGLSPDKLNLGRGEWETLLAALMFTFQILTLENPRFSSNRPLLITFVMFLGIAAVFSILTTFAAPSTTAILIAGSSLAVGGQILALAVLSTLGSYVLMNTFQHRITATEAGLIYCAEPVFTSIMVLFLPGLLTAWIGNTYANESWTSALVGGGLLITSANLVMQWHLPEGKPLG